MSRQLPLSALAAWWITAWLRGAVSADQVRLVLEERHPVHTLVAASPGAWPGEALGVDGLLFAFRASGVAMCSCALPAPGDLHGLRGPATLNRAALDAREAVVGIPAEPRGRWVGAVPVGVGAGAAWAFHEAAPRPASDLGHADRALRTAVRTAGDALAALDVASWAPDAVDALLNLEHAERPRHPPGVPERAVVLAARAGALLDVVDLAFADGTGGAVSAHEAFGREQVLDDLARAARHALVAACSPDAWPEG